MEELCFDYGSGSTIETLETTERIKCLCAAKICRKYLPNIQF